MNLRSQRVVNTIRVEHTCIRANGSAFGSEKRWTTTIGILVILKEALQFIRIHR